MSATGLSARDLASLLGRNQGPEFFFQQPFTALAAPIIPKNINLQRPMERIHLVWRGRVVIGVANYTTVAAEAPQTILQRARLTGTHRKFGSLTPIDISGATMFAYARVWRVRGSSLFINTARQPELTIPLAQIGTVFGNTGTYDLEIHYVMPLGPIFPAGPQKISTIPYFYYPEDWGNTLQLQVFFGDQTSFGTPGGTTTVTFSAFGSGTGSPVLNIYTNYEILGQLSKSISSAVVIRSEQNVISGSLGQVANNVRLALLQKQKTLNLLLKTGVLLTGTSGGVSVFASLSDTLIDFTQIVVDNKPVRNNFNNFAQKEYAGFAFDSVTPQGYMNFPFDDAMNPLTYYRGDLLGGGSTFELDTNVLSAAANQSGTFIQEQVLGEPGVGS